MSIDLRWWGGERCFIRRNQAAPLAQRVGRLTASRSPEQVVIAEGSLAATNALYHVGIFNVAPTRWCATPTPNSTRAGTTTGTSGTRRGVVPRLPRAQAGSSLSTPDPSGANGDNYVVCERAEGLGPAGLKEADWAVHAPRAPIRSEAPGSRLPHCRRAVTSGIEVRPIRAGVGSADFNEVFFDDVFVPAANVIGAPARRRVERSRRGTLARPGARLRNHRDDRAACAATRYPGAQRS